MENFKSSGTITKQAHVKIPEGLFEEEHGRKGFYGRVSHLYHKNPLTSWTNIEGDLLPRSLPPIFNDSFKKNTFITILFNQDVTLSVGAFNGPYKNFFRNADYDELFFIHKGQGHFETSYGTLPYVKGDYIIIPRGTTYKLFTQVSQGPTKILKVESFSEFEQPERGMLGPNALYDQTTITTPTAGLGSEQKESEYKIDVQRLGKISTITYPFNPLDVLGWKGSLYPWKISIYDICPVMSHKYHIPPSGHTTFVCKNFVICSFVARPLEHTSEGVLKVPFYHSNIDFDEVLFYHQGNFFSRDNIGEGALSFHPQGINHGPHPNAFKKANEKTFTDEYAVMVDARNPLQTTEWFNNHENKEYWRSWKS